MQRSIRNAHVSVRFWGVYIHLNGPETQKEISLTECEEF